MIPVSESTKRINASEYSSLLCSLLLTRYLEPNPANHNELLIECAMSCLARTTSTDVRKVIRHIICHKSPAKALVKEEERIQSAGMDIMEFLAMGSSMSIMGIR